MVNNRQVIFTKIPPSTGYPEPNEYLQVKNSPIDLDAPLKDGGFIVKKLVIAISGIIYHSMRAAGGEGPFGQFASKLGEAPMSSGAIGVVVKSSSGAKFQEGDLVFGNATTALEEYALVTKETDMHYDLRNEIKETKFPHSYYLGILGEIGRTAYTGLIKYGKPTAGETLYVSAAAGNVGLVVGQIGKALGLRVIGSAGSDEKLEYLKSIGYDAVFNYKTDDPSAKLKELCPEGIDIYFDNVGGRTLEIAIDHMKFRGRIVVCGVESQYYAEKQDGVHNLMQVLLKNLRIEGFNVFLEPKDEEREFIVQMTKWVQEGKVKQVETILDGFEAIPEGMTTVLSKKLTGKIVVNVSELGCSSSSI